MKYRISEEYRELGLKVIENIPELLSLKSADCRIEFLACEQKKTSNGRAVLGECIKVQELYKPFCPYDFLIVFYEPNIEGLNDDQLKILAEHELLHVGFEEMDDGTTKYFTKPHNYTEFKQIVDKYGADWAKAE